MSDQMDKLGRDIDKINTKLDKLVDHQHSIDKTLVKQEANISEHIRRTDLLEKKVEKMDGEYQPVSRYVNGMKFVGKSLVFVSLCVGLAIGIMKLLDL